MKQIPSLNGLRALSILAVIFSHEWYQYQNQLWKLGPVADGQFGVTVFFVLSGFLITWLLLHEEKDYGAVSVRNFFIRRSLRIFPAYYFVLLVYFILHCFGYMHLSLSSWFTAVTYSKYFNLSQDWETGHFWSLAVEEHFYILWIFCFRFLGRLRVSFAWLIVLICPLLRWFTATNSVPGLHDHHFLTRMDALMMGAILAFQYNEISSWLKRFAGRLMIPFALLLLVALGYAGGFMEEAGGRWMAISMSLVGHMGTLSLMAIALLIVASIEGAGLWVSFLNSSVMNAIGKLSYSLYLWQQFFLSPKFRTSFDLPWRWLMLAVAAILSYNLIEKPFLKLKTAFQKRWGSEQERSVPSTAVATAYNQSST